MPRLTFPTVGRCGPRGLVLAFLRQVAGVSYVADHLSPTPPPNRWGDYSGAGIDPSDQTKVWVAGEYAPKNRTGKSEWGTWIAEVGF